MANLSLWYLEGLLLISQLFHGRNDFAKALRTLGLNWRPAALSSEPVMAEAREATLGRLEQRAQNP